MKTLCVLLLVSTGLLAQVTPPAGKIPNTTTPGGFAMTTQQLYGRAMGLPPAPSGVAPTITLNASDQITNSAQFYSVNANVVDTTHFLYLGCHPIQKGPAFPNQNTIISDTLTGLNGTAMVTAESMIDASQFELVVNGQGQRIRVLIDGVEVMNAALDSTTGTAQAGGANTITLASGASAQNGNYALNYVFITGGTGAGQMGQVKSYVGSTKVATMWVPWATPPDATSVYRVNPTSSSTVSPPIVGALQYFLFDFGGARATRRVHVENGGAGFVGFRTDSSGTVAEPPPYLGPRMFVVGDSFGEGTGSNSPFYDYAAILANTLGFELWNDSSGSTGLNNPGTVGGGRLSYPQRTLPPPNAWQINHSRVTVEGTYTISQGGVTTASLATNASVTTVQTALDNAFGVGTFQVSQNTALGTTMVGLGATGQVTAPMTINVTGITGTMTLTQFLGDIAPYVPVDVNGKAMPFFIFVQGSVNDGGAFTTGLLDAATAYFTNLQTKFPTATVITSGPGMNAGPANAANKAVAVAMNAAATASLKRINGQVPVMNLFDPVSGIGYENGTTNIGAQSGLTGINTDMYVWWDGTHPTALGHVALANQFITLMSAILRGY